MDSVSKSDIDKNWGEILKNHRLKLGLTQEDLAEKIGISVKYISKIETGKSGIRHQVTHGRCGGFQADGHRPYLYRREPSI